MLIDQDTFRQAVADGEPWRYYDLGHGLCTYKFFEQCAHRMACARYNFYRPRQSSLAQLLDAKDNILRFVQQIPLTEDERAAVDGNLNAIDRLTQRLADRTTPSGQTPAGLGQKHPFAEWREDFPNAACLVALANRLVRNAETVVINGDSDRREAAEQRQKERSAERRRRRSRARPSSRESPPLPTH